MKINKTTLAFLCSSLISGTAISAGPVDLNNIPAGEGPALPDDIITQAELESGELALKRMRAIGGRVFTTAFNRFDGMGDGPPEEYDDTAGFPFRGDRSTLQNTETTMLRVSGLDAQSCVECHGTVSQGSVPPMLGIGGHGGINNSPMPGTNILDVTAQYGQVGGITETTGRVINPPFVFGAGGVEQIGKEMTSELQNIKAAAEADVAGSVYELTTKGVNFGTATSNGDGTATIEIDNEHGIDENLVVRPFGRKGENFSVRDFDRGAMAFHGGIQAVEVVGEDVDPDGDGVSNEITNGEMSALSIFLTTLPSPRQARLKGDAKKGLGLFKDAGCSDCHIPSLETDSRYLTQAFPDIATDPSANVFLEIDLHKAPMKFKKSRNGGVIVPMFADLKRHYMGEGLAESTGSEIAGFFTTARLWGIADSAPYMHDGRAATLTEAILSHGGEAQLQRDVFEAYSDKERVQMLSFLRSLKLPTASEVDRVSKLIAKHSN